MKGKMFLCKMKRQAFFLNQDKGKNHTDRLCRYSCDGSSCRSHFESVN